MGRSRYAVKEGQNRVAIYKRLDHVDLETVHVGTGVQHLLVIPLDPDAAPPGLRECRRTILVSVRCADLDKEAAPCADPTEDLRNDAVLPILRVNGAFEVVQQPWVSPHLVIMALLVAIQDGQRDPVHQPLQLRAPVRAGYQ